MRPTDFIWLQAHQVFLLELLFLRGHSDLLHGVWGMAERHLRLPQIWPAEQSRAWLGLLSSFAFTFGFLNKESLAFKRLISFVQDLHFSQRFAVFFFCKIERPEKAHDKADF